MPETGVSEQDREPARWARSTKARQIADRIREQMLRGPATGKMIPSERELARRFGVARNTVRKAIEILTRQGWLEGLSGQGHVIRTPAHRLTGISGLYFPLDPVNLLVAPFFRDIHLGICSEVVRQVRRLLTFYGDCGEMKQLTSDDFWSPDIRAIDSLLTIEVFDRELIEQAARLYPVVSLDGHSDLDGASTVCFDHDATVRMAVKYLFDLGHRRIGYLGRTENRDPVVAARLGAYRDAMRWAGLEAAGHGVISMRELKDVARAFRAWAAPPPALRATALIVESYFWEMFAEFLRNNVKIPADVSLVAIGVVNTWAREVSFQWAEQGIRPDFLDATLSPPFPNRPSHLADVTPTTVCLPARRMGRMGMEELARRLSDPSAKPLRQLLHPELAAGTTTAPRSTPGVFTGG